MAASCVAASVSTAAAVRGSNAPRVSARRGAAGAAAPRSHPRRGEVVRVAVDDIQMDPAMGPEMKSAIDRFVGENKVVLFMKGDRVGTHTHNWFHAHNRKNSTPVSKRTGHAAPVRTTAPLLHHAPRSVAARARHRCGLVGATTWVERWVWLARLLNVWLAREMHVGSQSETQGDGDLELSFQHR
jgi:hypothetical protein